MNFSKIFFALAAAAFACDSASFATEVRENPASAQPASAENFIATKIARVLVFPDGARVTRSAKIELRGGEQEFVFTNIPADADAFSAETSITDAKIISVSLREIFKTTENAEKPATTQEKLDRAVARETSLQKQLANARARQKTLLDPKTFFPDGNASDAAFDLGSALSALAFQRIETTQLSEEIIQLEKQLENARISREIIESELRFSANRSRILEKVVVVKIFSEQAATGTVSLDFVSSKAHWSPRHELYIDTKTHGAELISYGIIEQRTGEDWSDVPVELSTASAFRATNFPMFRKILITEKFEKTPAPAANIAPVFYDAAPQKARGNAKQSLAGTSIFENKGNICVALKNGKTADAIEEIRYSNGNYILKNTSGVLAVVAAGEIEKISQEHVEMTAGKSARSKNATEDLHGLDLRFPVAQTGKIGGNGTATRCPISKKSFSGDFYLRIVPAKRALAYRMLRVKNGGETPLLAGTTDIFYGNDFVGSMPLSFTETNATIEFPLGVEPRVSVERSRENAIGSAGTFSSSRHTEVSVLTKIKNHTKTAVRVECAEAVPVSVQEEIEVSTPKFSPAASFEKTTGIAEWNETLAPNAEIELRANYEIVYPENFSIKENAR